MFDNWANDEKVTKYVSFNPHKNYNETKQIINEWINEYSNGSYNWVVELKDNHEIIGNISVFELRKKHNNCELGYVFGSKFWGKGYATETLKIVIEYLIKECNFHLVEAKHHASNPVSGRVMEKAGMKKDGILTYERNDSAIDTFNTEEDALERLSKLTDEAYSCIEKYKGREVDECFDEFVQDLNERYNLKDNDNKTDLAVMELIREIVSDNKYFEPKVERDKFRATSVFKPYQIVIK